MENYDEGEESMLYEFKRASNYYLDQKEIPTTLIDWFALLQHYGMPTRLIDFTKLPYVAAYFAFEDKNNESDFVAIWIVNKICFYQKALYYLQEKKMKISDTKHYSFGDSTFTKIFNVSRTGDYDCVIPIESCMMNDRYYLQQSVFLSPSNPYKPFNAQLDFLKDIKEKCLFKLLLPKKDRKKALRDLGKMNISRASLFPGLDGFAKSLYLQFSTLTNMGEIGQNINFLKRENLI